MGSHTSTHASSNKNQYELSEEEQKLMMNDFRISIPYDHETFGKLISGNTDIRSLLQSANIMHRAVKHFDELFEKPLPEEEKEYFRVVATFDLVMKTMHSIECLASLLAPYRKRSPRFHEEITKYSLDDDATKILNRSRAGQLKPKDVQELYGFPAGGDKQITDESCNMILEYMRELSTFYFALREPYRRYKHGHPFGVIKWVREQGGKVIGHIPLLIYLEQDTVKKNSKELGNVWQFGVNWGGLLPYDPDELFQKIRIVFNLYFLAKYNCHMRTYYPERGLARALVSEKTCEEVGKASMKSQ